ncbi:MAG: polysaccharide biosynthesis protein [Alphaproteobacteria bacterium]
MAALSFAAALYLRTGDEFPQFARQVLLEGTLLFTAVAAIVFMGVRLYQGIWRYASLNDMMRIAKAATLTILIFLPLMFALTRLELLPRSHVIINWFTLVAFLAGPRILYRIAKDGRIDTVFARDKDTRVPVLLAGVGDSAELFLRAMGQRAKANYRVVGILSEKHGRVGGRIHGVEVLGTLDQLDEAVATLDARGQRPSRVVVARDRIDRPVLKKLVDGAERLGLTLARLPGLTEFKTGAADAADLQPIAIEDLLGRPQNVLDRPAMARLIAGKRVMVTGAGGSIGGELVRQIADLGPKRLVLVDHSEFHLYEIDLELGQRKPDLARAAHLADVRDARRVDALIGGEKPELVFHAAALKHVPMVELHPNEGVLTNVIGTRNVADACLRHGVAAMVQISTDKAVNPSSVMGATKRLAENYCQALDLTGPDARTHFVTVRFGNVLGSTGSVVPLFQRQLAMGGPLTVTDPEVTRYFMTVREAVELVLMASALGAADRAASGKIFVLDMGEPIKIVDLARKMIRLAGLIPDQDVKIAFTGLRPGEKLHEELLHHAEELMPTVYQGVMLAAPRAANGALLARALAELEEAARDGRTADVLTGLQRLVPEFHADARGAAAQ